MILNGGHCDRNSVTERDHPNSFIQIQTLNFRPRISDSKFQDRKFKLTILNYRIEILTNPDPEFETF